VAIEVRVGENVGMMNVAMNSLTIARLRERFDHNKSYKKVAGEEEQMQRLNLFHRASLELEAYLQASAVRVEDLLQVGVGDVLLFDLPVSTPVELLLNRHARFQGQVVTSRNKRALLVEGRADPNSPPVPAAQRTGVGRAV
jgi:flagellar motor switch protein FliM